MYLTGETCQAGQQTYERIVFVGVNETKGRLDGRLKGYGRDRGTPLHVYVHDALAATRKVRRQKRLVRTLGRAYLWSVAPEVFPLAGVDHKANEATRGVD